ncbi:MAG TPA: ABC transporter ATP-binding protein [Mycobacteriales bacterium]|jgi:ABC-type polysaccharide/polyol phosphate transport system ATPase subunit|nr:ABC transporter ATP-binding protein [Mycobacteriales bacterium]
MSRDVGRGGVRFEGVTKEYRLGKPRAFLAAAAPWGDGIGRGDRLKALDDVTFSIEPGESFALIGANGAGKSTALKVLAGVTHPTRGRVVKGGRVVALIELGIGFHPDLSGLENAKFAATISGLRGAAAKRLVEQAVEFAEIERFATTPVKRYSSGMYARLSFGIAAHLPADILIVDEILAVGDLAFQRKCYAHLSGLRRNDGVTLMFVSHNDWVLKETCERGALISHGKVVAEGPVKMLLDQYHAAPDPLTTSERTTSERIVVGNVDTVPAGVRSVGLHESLTLECEVTVAPGTEHAVLGVAWANKDRQLLWAAYSDERGIALPPGKHVVRLVVEDVNALPGPNIFELLAFDRTSPVIEQSRLFDIEVVGDQHASGNWDHGLVDVPTQWSLG